MSGCLERPALLAGNLTAGYSWHCPAAWARAAGHPLPGPTLATGVAGHPQQHLAATWRGELTGRWQHDWTGLPGPPDAHGTATTDGATHGSALAADLIRACAGWPRDLAARGSRARGLPEELDAEHDHAQHASLRYALSSARSRLQQSLASATAVRAPAQYACIALHCCAGIAMHGHA